ncbi:MAG TPA: 50S ribosomal protein L29 [Thermomicrobiales bacterium]|nr:50S ribosomal protein L29 [Thermomicrobiales bacterium]
MKPSELRVMSDEQLNERLDELREEWRQLRFDRAVGRLSNTRRIWQIRRDIARIRTIQREREIEAEVAAALAESGN